jgi:hypothetical protein
VLPFQPETGGVRLARSAEAELQGDRAQARPGERHGGRAGGGDYATGAAAGHVRLKSLENGTDLKGVFRVLPSLIPASTLRPAGCHPMLVRARNSYPQGVLSNSRIEGLLN